VRTPEKRRVSPASTNNVLTCANNVLTSTNTVLTSTNNVLIRAKIDPGATLYLPTTPAGDELFFLSLCCVSRLRNTIEVSPTLHPTPDCWYAGVQDLPSTLHF